MNMSKKVKFLNINRVSFFSLALMLTSIPSILFIDLMVRTGYEINKIILTILFVILMANIGWGTAHAITGFILRRFRNRSGMIEATLGTKEIRAEHLASTAITLPIYNEDPLRVFAGVRSMYESLLKTGMIEHFDFFILSDSTNSERWVEEEEAWATLCRDLDAFGSIHYRRRRINTDSKAGNIHDFCEDWGKLYRYMITMDADSIMSGEVIVKLAAMMELNPKVGIIQTVPSIMYGESLWGRTQQFANRFYGPIFMFGLNYWQQGSGNYWGHNAIIRMAAFMKYCALPGLPGREPFGGKILSHDFVEAALISKVGYEVWLTLELGGSYEEGPQDLAEHLTRDRRWCQGNMQHLWVLFSKGLMPASRTHLANGIMSYVSSFVWLVYLILGGIMVYNQERSQLTVFPFKGFINVLNLSLQAHGQLIMEVTFAMLLLGKILALLDAILTKNCGRFGGVGKVVYSVFIETILSILVAPIFMIYHSGFVVSTALGKGVGWKTQNRGVGKGLSLLAAIQCHWGSFMIGCFFAWASSYINKFYFWWLSPVWIALILSPLTSYTLSKASIGKKLRSLGLLLIPEELQPEAVLVDCKKYTDQAKIIHQQQPFASPSFMRALVDPYNNAISIHMAEHNDSLNREKPAQDLLIRILRDGVETLNEHERKIVLMDPEMLLTLYQKLWIKSPDQLHPSWVNMINSYNTEYST